ncbi:hypothetical protein [Pseudooctadecabacter jejudonensis]|uniref:Sulfotransferase family protein n=1 Tax=Pseudooctadecabacter jejudonensis TaxID=1391910 RepID=A0A1Y5RZL6_9RHOB|nr:hypothetical protein [Pseudooctadecabacter jejudonensis]SLN26621.1 hypothetical protein PSJ8397_01070 [Pseudooctadecabacter jejudonensis]
MVLVSHAHAFVYLKTFKTAGTSAEMALEPLCAPAGHVPQHACPAQISDVGIIGARMKPASTDTTGWWGHLSAAATRAKLGDALWAAYDRIAVLRNPFDKAVSWFYWSRRKDDTEGRTMIDAFRAFIAAQTQAGFFGSPRDFDLHSTHINGTNIITGWFRMETLRQDLDLFARDRGIAPATLALAATKRGRRSSDTLPVAAYYDTKTADIIRRHYAWMFDIGGYSLYPQDAQRASREVLT